MSRVVLVAALLVTALVQASSEVRCKGTANPFPVHTDAPVLQNSVANGKRYLAGTGNDTFTVLHLWGSPYEQGYAQGQLMKDSLVPMHDKFMAYVDDKIKQEVPWLPAWLIDLVAEFGLPVALDMTLDWTKPFTPKRYMDEMHGIADGGNVTRDMVVRLNLFPELIKAACTIVGANGKSTPNGNLFQYRGLDFSPHMPIKDFAQVTIYHGSNGEPDIANVGWTMLVGSLTALTNRAIGVGEKVWLDTPPHVEGVKGQPWMFILRDVLYTKNITQAMALIKNANRTCAIHAGVGDSTTNSFRGVKMAKHYFKAYNDTDQTTYPQHPVIPGVVYWDKHKQPTHSYCLSDLLKHYYGSLDARTLAIDVAAKGMTGDMHAVAMDYMGQAMYVANARKSFVNSGALPAYARQYSFLNLTKLFAEDAPTV